MDQHEASDRRIEGCVGGQSVVAGDRERDVAEYGLPPTAAARARPSVPPGRRRRPNPFGPTASATRKATSPGPAPRSSTRMPGPMPLSRINRRVSPSSTRRLQLQTLEFGLGPWIKVRAVRHEPIPLREPQKQNSEFAAAAVTTVTLHCCGAAACAVAGAFEILEGLSRRSWLPRSPRSSCAAPDAGAPPRQDRSRSLGPLCFRRSTSHAAGPAQWSGQGNQNPDQNVAYDAAAKPRPEDRIAWIDYAKGWSIVLVVTMHSALGVGLAVGEQGWLHEVVAFAKPFRMPDFFLVAGLFAGRAIEGPWRAFTDRKVLHFVYFYALWLFIALAVKSAQNSISPRRLLF